jgi:MFS family permease
MPIVLVLLLSAVMFISMKGSRVLMTLFALELGAGPLETGMLFAVYGLFPFLLAVRAGRIADQFGNRALMYIGLSTFAVSLVLPLFFPHLATLFAVAGLTGVTSMLFVVATQNLVGLLADAASRTRNYSWYSLGDSGGAVLGPIVVGVCIDQLGHVPAFAVLAAIPVLCLVVLHVKREFIPNTVGAKSTAHVSPSRDLLKLPALRNALLTNGIVMTGLDLYNVYFPVYAKGIGLSATTIGLVMGAFGTAAFVVRLLIPPVTRRVGERKMIAVALALAAVAYVTIPLMHDPWLLGAVSFAVGLGIGCGQPLSMALSFNAAPPGRSAETIAMRLMVSYGTHVFIPPVFGAFGAVLGLAPVFWTCAMLLGGGSYLNRGARRESDPGSGTSAL